MTSYDTPTTVSTTRPATADTVPLSAVEAADRYATGRETHIEQAQRLVAQLRDDVALGRTQRDETDIGRTFGTMQWRLINLGYVLAAIQEG